VFTLESFFYVPRDVSGIVTSLSEDVDPDMTIDALMSVIA
jgi:hypothetical protein